MKILLAPLALIALAFVDFAAVSVATVTPAEAVVVVRAPPGRPRGGGAPGSPRARPSRRRNRSLRRNRESSNRPAAKSFAAGFDLAEGRAAKSFGRR